MRMSDERRPGTTGTPTDQDIDRSMIGYRGRRRVTEIMVDEEIISPENLERALELQKQRLADTLIEIGACKAEDLDRALSLQKMGLTRAQKFRRLLRVALVAVLVLTLGFCALVLRLESSNLLLVRLQRADLGVDEVARIVGDSESPYAAEALRSLAPRLSDPRAAGILTAALKHDRWYVRMYAAALAMEARNKELVPALIPLLADPNKLVTPVALQALESLTGARLPPTPQSWMELARSRGLAPVRGRK
jgi:hypothetical protein